MERTFVLVKPDGVQRRLIGEIIRRFENKGLKLVGLKLMNISKDRAERHYAIHKGRPFYGDLIQFITSSPSVAMVLEGRDAVKLTRVMMGATKPEDSTPGSIRGDFEIYTGQKLVHGSDSPETARQEIENFFTADELVEYPLCLADWIG
ncbi:MAG: nucleoside-diphosphate kinase [Candidatus Riflebacteria bacterium]|nr:nucleoside-diphosphate kinase [Candidatus Riflebacteria bacterium]